MLYLVKKNEVAYLDIFGFKNIPEEIKEFIKEFPGNKDIKTNIFRVQEDNSIMCGYFCIEFIDFMLASKKFTDYTNLFSPHDLKKNDNIILPYFKNEWIQFSIEYNSIKNNSLEATDKTVLSEQTKFMLSEIIEIEKYFYQEINQRKSRSKKLNKYVTTFDYK